MSVIKAANTSTVVKMGDWCQLGHTAHRAYNRLSYSNNLESRKVRSNGSRMRIRMYRIVKAMSVSYVPASSLSIYMLWELNFHSDLAIVYFESLALKPCKDAGTSVKCADRELERMR